MVIKKIRDAVRFINNPNDGFSKLSKRTFESVLNDYLSLLIFFGFFCGLTGLIYSFGKAFYLDVFRDMNVHYFRLLNYSVGSSVSIVFLYLFCGTFALFVLSLFLRPFCRGIKFVNILKVLFYAATPVLLFSWVRPAIAGLFFWSAILFFIGIRAMKADSRPRRNSIDNRD